MKRETVNISAGVFSLSKISRSKVKVCQLLSEEKNKRLIVGETSKLMAQVDMEHLKIHVPIHLTIFQIAWVFVSSCVRGSSCE